MTKTTVTMRTIPAGAPLAGAEYNIIRESDDVELDDGVTDADGQFTYSPNGSPGPWRWDTTDTSTTPETVRSGSTKSAGSGGSYSLYEVPIALRALGNGVIDGYLNELAVTDPDSGPNLAYATGAVLLRGIPGVWSTAGTYAVTDHVSQDATHPKACYLVIELTGMGEAAEGKMEMKAICGAAAASPSLPTPTTTEAAFQYPLYSFTLGNSASSNTDDIATGSLVDVRTFLGTLRPLLSSTVRRTDTVTPTTTISTTGEDVTSLTTALTLVNNVVYDLEAWGAVLVKAPASQTVSIAPYLNGTGNIATYTVSSESADYTLLENAHSLAAVTGTGAAVSCGMRWKVSSGTGNALTGIFIAKATPRS
jgi:hypothetical protein